jgi:hypothetical protein
MIEWGHAARITELDQAAAEQLGGFFSRHGHVLNCFDELHTAAGEVLDWLTGPDAIVPGRRSAPQKVRRAIDEWHRSLRVELDFPPETPLARGPSAMKRIPGIEVWPIETIGELVRESLEMRNCVASFAYAAVHGVTCFYRGRVDSTRITIAIEGTDAAWRLKEASGVANRKLDPEARILVLCWVRALRRQARTEATEAS